MKLDNSYDESLPGLASASKRGLALGSFEAQDWEQPHCHQYYLFLHAQVSSPDLLHDDESPAAAASVTVNGMTHNSHVTRR